jgi:hypothetical protein
MLKHRIQRRKAPVGLAAMSIAGLLLGVAVGVWAQDVPYTATRYPGVKVRHVPRPASARRKLVPHNQLHAPVIHKGERPGDGQMIQLDENYAVRETIPARRAAHRANTRHANTRHARTHRYASKRHSLKRSRHQ